MEAESVSGSLCKLCTDDVGVKTERVDRQGERDFTCTHKKISAVLKVVTGN